MDGSTNARMSWAEAKLIHYSSDGDPTSSSSAEEDLSLTDPSSISLALRGHCTVVVELDGVTSERKLVPGGITLCGPEPLRWLGGSGSGASEFIEITATAAFRRDLADELGVAHHFALDDGHGWSDPIVWAVAARLRSAARRTIALDDLERDALLRRLYARILETRFGGRERSRGNGGLDELRLKRVFEFIEAHLGDRLTIARLAEVAALSPFHFVRAFRRSCGLTPHRYVRARRLEQARNLIAAGVGPRSVARRIGYESFSHFRTAYHSHFGVALPPGKARTT